ncbi:MAG: aminodeoxychorismate synthase component I, partial [Armatimonadetes bacterium]|nr:aminodeoxychorismate synthase component I [Armatimonadota bacterium]
KGEKIKICFQGKEKIFTGNPLETLREILANFKINSRTSYPFLGGGMGYLAYELKDFIEKLPNLSKDDLKLPELYFVFYNNLLIFDKLNKKLLVSINDFPNSKLKSKNLLRRFKKIKENLKRTVKLKKEPVYFLGANFTKENYLKSVKKIIDYIYAGDVYQINLSQRFCAKTAMPSYLVFKNLIKRNPVPFSAYLNLRNFEIASASPERFLSLNNDWIETRPIKGTRPRGANKIEDLKLKKSLLESKKDQAELSMIVDLERNDLGKVCEIGSVKVKEHKRLEEYAGIFHLISIIKGKLKKDKDIIDLIKSTFPGGSITGVPKIRAMEIIEELEPVKRGVYTGAIGYLSFHNTLDLNIAIRTFLFKNNKVYFQAGGGIVIDSKPEDEYQETLDKAKIFLQTLI